MRIVHTCLRYPPATGGVETYVKEIVERTRQVPQSKEEEKRIRDVRVLTSRMRTHGPITELDPEFLVDDPPYVQRLHHAQFPVFSYPILQALNYYISHHKPDILHSYSFWYQPADITAWYARRHNIPFIFHPIYYENEVRKKLPWQLYKHTIGKQTFAAADVVAVISPYEQELIERADLPVKRFELLPPGIDTNEFFTQHENVFQAKGLAGPILLSVARLAQGKGLDDVLTALPAIVKTHPSAHLVLIGEDFGAEQELKKQAEALNISSHVHFWGNISRKELIGAYQHATILVHPSHYEAFGIVLAEALCAKTTVVARNSTAIPFVAPHEKAGLLFSSTEELTQHVIRLLNDENQRRVLGAWGREHVVTNFSWDTTVKKLLGLYDELANEHRS